MSDSSNAVSIIGFVFFALSELLPLLPIPANGFLHSLFIGLKNSFAKQTKNVDLEIAQSLVNTRPEFVELVNTIEGNSNLIDALKMLTKSPELVSLVQKIADDKNLQLINTLLINNLKINEIDYFIFHQANKYMLEMMRRKMNIPSNKFIICIENYGNTVSNTIPIALRENFNSELFKRSKNIILCGFGVGLSMSICNIIKN